MSSLNNRYEQLVTFRFMKIIFIESTEFGFNMIKSLWQTFTQALHQILVMNFGGSS